MSRTRYCRRTRLFLVHPQHLVHRALPDCVESQKAGLKDGVGETDMLLWQLGGAVVVPQDCCGVRVCTGCPPHEQRLVDLKEKVGKIHSLSRIDARNSHYVACCWLWWHIGERAACWSASLRCSKSCRWLSIARADAC